MSTNKQGRGGTLPPGQPLFTQDATPLRQAIERRSAVLLVFLRHLPSWLLPVILVVLLVTGLAVGGVIGAVALGLVALFLGWLALLSWPRLAGSGRLLRVAVTGIVVLAAVVQGVR